MRLGNIFSWKGQRDYLSPIKISFKTTMHPLAVGQVQISTHFQIIAKKLFLLLLCSYATMRNLYSVRGECLATLGLLGKSLAIKHVDGCLRDVWPSNHVLLH